MGSKTKMSKIIRNLFTKHNNKLLLVSTALEVICLGFFVIGVYRKNRGLTLPALVLYPIKSCIYEIPAIYYFVSYVLSESNDLDTSYVFMVIGSSLFKFVRTVLSWMIVLIYRRQLKEQSRMVVCSGENFYVNQPDCE